MAKRAIPVGPARVEGKSKPSLGLSNTTVLTRQGIQIKPAHSTTKEKWCGHWEVHKEGIGERRGEIGFPQKGLQQRHVLETQPMSLLVSPRPLMLSRNLSEFPW